MNEWLCFIYFYLIFYLGFFVYMVIWPLLPKAMSLFGFIQEEIINKKNNNPKNFHNHGFFLDVIYIYIYMLDTFYLFEYRQRVACIGRVFFVDEKLGYNLLVIWHSFAFWPLLSSYFYFVYEASSFKYMVISQ